MTPSERLARAQQRIWRSARIEADFRTLCGFGGRFAGTASEAEAREWLAARLAEAARTSVAREVVAYRGWTRGDCRIGLADGRVLPAVGLVRTPSTPPGGISARLLDLGRGRPEDFELAGEAVRGAIVLVRHEYMIGPDHLHRRRKYDAARKAGAAGFVIAYYDRGGLPVTGSSGDGGDGHIPAVGVSFETAEALRAATGPVSLVTGGIFHAAEAQNLLATLPGKGAARVVLSAHYDGHDLAGSAIDNGTGVTAALAVVEALADLVPEFSRGLEVALFSVEEWALIGSRTHLDGLSSADRLKIAFNVNLDSVAGGSALTAITGGFPGVAEFVERSAPGVGTHHGFMANSDHANYVAHGIPALRLCSGFDEPGSNLRFLLTPADTPDKVTVDEIKRAAAVAVALVLAACTEADLPSCITPEAGRKRAGL